MDAEALHALPCGDSTGVAAPRLPLQDIFVSGNRAEERCDLRLYSFPFPPELGHDSHDGL